MMSLADYVFPIANAIRPDPAVAAPDDLAVGDTVSVLVEDWLEGQHELEGVVTQVYLHGRVKIEVRLGTECRRYSVPRADLRLVRRAS